MLVLESTRILIRSLNAIDKLQKVYDFIINNVLLLRDWILLGRALKARTFSDYVFSWLNLPPLIEELVLCT